MQKRTLIKKLAERLDISVAETERFFDVLNIVIADSLVENEVIPFGFLGRLKMYELKEATLKVPHNGDWKIIKRPRRYSVGFVPSETLKKDVNQRMGTL